MNAALKKANESSLGEAAKLGGAWQTDSSRHTVGPQVNGDEYQDGTLLVAPREGRTTLRVCYLFSGVQRKASIGNHLKKLCETEGIGLVLFEVDILVGGSGHDLLDKASQDKWMARIESGDFDVVILSPPCGDQLLGSREAPWPTACPQPRAPLGASEASVRTSASSG